jgi:hypothetical protein
MDRCIITIMNCPCIEFLPFVRGFIDRSGVPRRQAKSDASLGEKGAVNIGCVI